MTPNPAFKGTQLFDVGFLRNDTGWTHGNYRPLKPGTVHTGNKVDSSRSTLLKVNKVDRVEFNFVPAVSIPGLTESDMWPRIVPSTSFSAILPDNKCLCTFPV